MTPSNAWHDVVQTVRRGRLIAIIRVPRLDGPSGAALAETVVSAGVTALEFTLTCPGAWDALRAAREVVSGRGVVGVGTVLRPEEVEKAADGGAQFVVSPDVEPAVVERAVRHGLPALPGAYTATEIRRAVDCGAAMVKLFPAQPAGPAYLRALRAPLPDVAFVPTGGIALDDVPAFLAAGAVAVGLGTSLVHSATDLRGVAERARRARRVVASGQSDTVVAAG